MFIIIQIVFDRSRSFRGLEPHDEGTSLI